MKHKFTVVIESNDDSEDREVVKDCLQGWLELNCGTENVPYVNAASLWHDLKEDKPPLRKWVMFRYSGGGVNPTALHYGAMSDDVWIVTRGDGTQRIEVLYECYDKIEWLDFDELK